MRGGSELEKVEKRKLNDINEKRKKSREADEGINTLNKSINKMVVEKKLIKSKKQAYDEPAGKEIKERYKSEEKRKELYDYFMAHIDDIQTENLNIDIIKKNIEKQGDELDQSILDKFFIIDYYKHMNRVEWLDFWLDRKFREFFSTTAKR